MATAPFLSAIPPIPPQLFSQGGSSSLIIGASGNAVGGLLLSPTGVQPGAIGADNVLAAFTLPALFFDGANRGLQLTAAGSFGATGNNKTLKLFAGATTAVVGSTISGGTAIASTGVVTTNGGGWQIQASVYKYGSMGANTQIAIHQPTQVGGAVGTLLVPQLLTMTESGALIFAITGNVATATSDIVLNFFEAFAMN